MGASQILFLFFVSLTFCDVGALTHRHPSDHGNNDTVSGEEREQGDLLEFAFITRQTPATPRSPQLSLYVVQHNHILAIWRLGIAERTRRIVTQRRRQILREGGGDLNQDVSLQYSGRAL